jgi:two-component system, LytTR family, response regulator
LNMKKQLTALIAEDMAEYLETIVAALNQVAPDVKIVGKATTLEETEKMIGQLAPSMVVLDIAFEAEGKTSFDLLHGLRDKGLLNFHIVFITAHSESHFYSKAFEFKAIHFIEKPLALDKLSEAIRRIRDLEVSNSKESKEKKLAEEIGILSASKMNTKIVINGPKFDEIYDRNEIIWIEADGRSSIFHFKNGGSVLCSRSLGEIEKELSNTASFFRIHRSEIINLNHVERYSRKERLVILTGKFQNHYVAKEKFDEFVWRIKYGV